MHEILVQQLGEKPRHFDFSIPSNWEEMDKKKLLAIAPLIMRWMHIRLQETENVEEQHLKLIAIQIECFKKLAGIPDKASDKRQKCFAQFSDQDIEDVLPLLDWLMQPGLTTSLIPFFRLGIHRFYAPDHFMKNITGGEFHFCESFYQQYLQQNDPEAIHQLIAVLYRPKGKGAAHNPQHKNFKGDPRIKLNPIEKRAAQFQKLDEATKAAILIWYQGCRQHIIDTHPQLFKKEDGTASGSWMDVFDSLSDNLVNFNTIADQPLSMILYKMTRLQEQAEKKSQ